MMEVCDPTDAVDELGVLVSSIQMRRLFCCGLWYGRRGKDDGHSSRDDVEA